MAYTRSMGQQPWWFQLLAAGSDDSDDDAWLMSLFDDEGFQEADARKYKAVYHKHINYLSDDEKQKEKDAATGIGGPTLGPQLMQLFGWVF